MKNSSDTIGNRTRDLPTCSAVPQPTALQRQIFALHKTFPYFLSSIARILLAVPTVQAFLVSVFIYLFISDLFIYCRLLVVNFTQYA